MTDRELLDAAAKACSIQNAEYTTVRWLHVNPDNEYASGWWNPLTDDGDALRLAVALRMTVSIIGEGMAEADNDVSQRVHEYCVDDTAAATRRAIVKAAAGMIKHGTP